MANPQMLVRPLGIQDYSDTWQRMRAWTDERSDDTQDECWVVEHPPVFTQGQAGKAEHLIAATDIPVVQSDRGGQITYHGPGQLVVYPLLNLKRLKLGVRDLVSALEDSTVSLFGECGLKAYAKPDAPGVYVLEEGTEKKIASLGLRVRKGCSFHGIAINVHADLSPFQLINPCGYAGLEMANLNDLANRQLTLEDVASRFVALLGEVVGVEPLWQPS